VRALGEEDAVTSIVGLARRRPKWQPAKTEWAAADISSDDLGAPFEGADAVVHLAWLIQPSRRTDLLWRTNVAGSRRVFDAAARAGATTIVYASSVGAYSPDPKDRRVDERWPVMGCPPPSIHGTRPRSSGPWMPSKHSIPASGWYASGPASSSRGRLQPSSVDSSRGPLSPFRCCGGS